MHSSHIRLPEKNSVSLVLKLIRSLFTFTVGKQKNPQGHGQWIKSSLNNVFVLIYLMFPLDISVHKTFVFPTDVQNKVFYHWAITANFLQICHSRPLVNVNTPTQLANQVFTEHHKCHEGSAKFTQKQMRESTFVTGKSSLHRTADVWARWGRYLIGEKVAFVSWPY